MASHEETVRREFAKQAESFADPAYAFADRRLIDWIHAHVPPEPGGLVLDVAGGTGQLARSYAQTAAVAVVADLTPEMLETGMRECEVEAVRNVLFVSANAADLPFLDGGFDLVMSRFAVHHFEEPSAQIGEMARVCRSGGRVAIVDLVAPDPGLAAEHDRLERLRDPSHTRALPVDELVGLLERSGLGLADRAERDIPVPIERWLAQTQTRDEVGGTIRAELEAELAGGKPTGMRPQIRDGELCQTQCWAILVGRK